MCMPSRFLARQGWPAHIIPRGSTSDDVRGGKVQALSHLRIASCRERPALFRSLEGPRQGGAPRARPSARFGVAAGGLPRNTSARRRSRGQPTAELPKRVAFSPLARFGGKLSLERVRLRGTPDQTAEPSARPREGRRGVFEPSGRGAWHPGNHGRSDEHASYTAKGGLRTK